MIFNIQSRGRLRVWINELPDARLIGNQCIEKILKQGELLPSSSSLALEWKLPHGGFASYGMLGVTIASHVPPCVRSKYACDQEQVFDGALVNPPADQAYIALSKDYATAAIDAIAARVDEIGGLGSVLLFVEVAACGMVGSSNRHFAAMGRMLAGLLLLPTNPTLEEVERNLQA